MWEKTIDNIRRAERINKVILACQCSFSECVAFISVRVARVCRVFVTQVRDHWRQLQDFCRSSVFEREVIDSILDGTVDGYRIDATLLNVRIPDLLLRECEQEIQRVRRRRPQSAPLTKIHSKCARAIHITYFST